MVKSLLSAAGALFIAAGIGVWLFVEWTINRVYVPVGHSLLLRYKGPLLLGARRAAVGRFAERDKSGVLEVGVLEQMPGPGRHFYSPIWWERKLVPDVVVKPGQIGLVTSKLGENLPGGGFLVDGEMADVAYNGVLRKVYGPGRYRVNPYGFEFQIVESSPKASGTTITQTGWVEVPAGFVGVVTNLTDNVATGQKAGIQDEVLQPGLYLVNPRERKIDIVLVGFFETSLTTNLLHDREKRLVLDPSGEPQVAQDESGISFASADGFPVHVDFTAIWGILPDQAPNVIKSFGNVDAVEQKIIIPQVESICRNQGSHYGAPQLLAGDSREEFQQKASAAFAKALKEKELSLLNGLVRYIYIPQKVRLPIQKANLANELKLTSDQQELTAKTEGLLREAEKNVDLAGATVRAETEKLVAQLSAEARKTAAETSGKTQQMLAEIDRKTAELERSAKVLLGQAEAKSTQLLEEAKADKFRLAVESFGGAAAYNQWVFANGLPENINLNMLYAGQGTFWTDLKGFSDTMIGKQHQDATARPAPATVPPQRPAR